MKSKILQFVAVGGVAVIALIGGLLAARMLLPAEQAPTPVASIGGDFTLTSNDGDVSLQQFRGKVVAIYFGYTYCPDACPMSLAYLGLAMKQLSWARWCSCSSCSRSG